MATMKWSENYEGWLGESLTWTRNGCNLRHSTLGLLLQQANGKLVASPAPCRRSCLHFGDGGLCGR